MLLERKDIPTGLSLFSPQSGPILCNPIDSGEGNGTPLQYSRLENPMDGGDCQAAVHGVARSRTRLIDFTFTFHFHALEKEMATHSSVLAWRIPGTGEPQWAAVYGVAQSQTRLKRFSSSSSRLQPTRILCPWDFPDKNTEIPTEQKLRNPRIKAQKGPQKSNLTPFHLTSELTVQRILTCSRSYCQFSLFFQQVSENDLIV